MFIDSIYSIIWNNLGKYWGIEIPKNKTILPDNKNLPTGIFYRPDRPRPYQVRIKRNNFSINESYVNRASAISRARSFIADVERNIWQDTLEADRTTLAKAFERYYDEILPRKKSAKFEEYRIRALCDVFGDKTLSKLSSSDIAKWRTNEENRGIAPSTILKSFALISHLYNTAKKEWGINVNNPIANVKKPIVRNARDRLLSDEEETRLFNAINNRGKQLRVSLNIWLYPITILAIETAARQSELLSLKWKDVNLKDRVAKLRGIDGRETKNGDPFREVPLSPKAIKVLIELPKSIDGRVFATTQEAIRQSFTRAVKRAKIENFHFHDLRHIATSRLAQKLDVLELARVTGHKDLKMLLRYYHAKPKDLAKKLAKS